jgi:hypothetical protein
MHNTIGRITWDDANIANSLNPPNLPESLLAPEKLSGWTRPAEEIYAVSDVKTPRALLPNAQLQHTCSLWELPGIHVPP